MVMTEPVSRRSFLTLLSAGFISLFLWWFRRSDLSSVVQEFFGFPQNVRKQVLARFAVLRRRNAVLYQESVLFFGLHRVGGERILPKALQRRVIGDWVDFFFYNHELAWSYIGYPSVSEYQICNGLVRK